MPSDYEWLRVTAADFRTLEVLVAGPVDGLPLVYQGGTPTAAAPWSLLHDLAAERGLRVVRYSRPGYAGSGPHPGRTVADAAGDIAAILDHLGAGNFVSIGWSGGGPHSLACAAMLPGRCLAAASGAGVAPYPSDGLEWLAGMGDDNVREFTAALEGEAALRAFILPFAERLATIQPREIAETFHSLVSDVDRATLTSEYAEYVADELHRAVSTGIEGWVDDDLAFTRGWGFDLPSITVPVAIWQGGQDLMVPFAHGAWLAERIPGAVTHLYPEHGHLSLSVAMLGDVIDDLLRIAGVTLTPGRRAPGSV